MSDFPLGELAHLAARWEHGHDELTAGCALCVAEWAEVYDLIYGPRPTPPAA
jgi:hypothetical protein